MRNGNKNDVIDQNNCFLNPTPNFDRIPNVMNKLTQQPWMRSNFGFSNKHSANNH